MYLFDLKMFNKSCFSFSCILAYKFWKTRCNHVHVGTFSVSLLHTLLVANNVPLLNDHPLNADNAHLCSLKNTWYVMRPFCNDKVEREKRRDPQVL